MIGLIFAVLMSVIGLPLMMAALKRNFNENGERNY